MSAAGEQDAMLAVERLRLLIASYEGVDVHPGSRIARQLEAASEAVAAYDAAHGRPPREGTTPTGLDTVA